MRCDITWKSRPQIGMSWCGRGEGRGGRIRAELWQSLSSLLVSPLFQRNPASRVHLRPHTWHQTPVYSKKCDWGEHYLKCCFLRLKEDWNCHVDRKQTASYDRSSWKNPQSFRCRRRRGDVQTEFVFTDFDAGDKQTRLFCLISFESGSERARLRKQSLHLINAIAKWDEALPRGSDDLIYNMFSFAIPFVCCCIASLL